MSAPITRLVKTDLPLLIKGARWAFLLGALLLLFILLNSSAGVAATLGLLLNEDFTTTTRQDPPLTNANRSTDEQALILAWRQKQFGVFSAGLAGSDITSNALSMASLALGDVNGDSDLDLVGGDKNISAAVVIPAPGGVNPNLQLWLKADAGVTQSGGAVSQWSDQSGNGFQAIQTTGADKPSLLPNELNTNPVINFDGVSDDLLITNGIFGTTAHNDLNIYAVANTKVITESRLFSEDVTPTRISVHLPWTDNNVYWDAGQGLGQGVAPYRLGVPWGGQIDTPYLWGFLYSTSATANGNKQEIIRNGSVIGQDTTATAFTGTNQGFSLGSEGMNPFNGDIAELIVYVGSIDANQHTQIQSYLALKYGLTIDGVNYVDSAGNTLWNAGTNITYTNDVAGIGIDAGSALTQTTSRSVNADSLVTITGTVANIVDGEFLLWGNDDGATTASTEVPGGSPSPQRLTREWKAAETGETGNVTIAFELSGLVSANEIDLSRPTDFALLTDADGDFGDATATTGATVVGNTVTFTGVDLADGQFFSLAFPGPSAPGGVSTDLQLWLKADAGVTASAGSVSAWADQSGNNLFGSLTPGSAGTQNTLLTPNGNGINNNRFIEFDTDDYLVRRSLPGTGVFSAQNNTLFAVMRHNSGAVDLAWEGSQGNKIGLEANSSGNGTRYNFGDSEVQGTVPTVGVFALRTAQSDGTGNTLSINSALE